MGKARRCCNPVKVGAPEGPVSERYYIQRRIIKQVRIIFTLFTYFLKLFVWLLRVLVGAQKLLVVARGI